MRSFIDGLNREIQIADFPERIISLVPSQTELLYDLGLEDRVIAITKFCIHPEKWFHSKKRIGGTKNFKIEMIKSLNPDLIIGNKEENTEAGLTELMQEFPVWISDIKTLDDSLWMIRETGEITDSTEAAGKIIQAINSGFKNLHDYCKINHSENNRVCYLIWQKPYITVGADTFISDMLNRCNLKNVFSNELRYPKITIDEIRSLQLDYLFLSSEPFPFNESHVLQLKKELPGVNVKLADGEYFSWYGSRLARAPSYFESLLMTLKEFN